MRLSRCTVVGCHTVTVQAIEAPKRIYQLEWDLLAWYRSNDLTQRIATVPGVSLLGASALAATITDPTQFRSAANPRHSDMCVRRP
ncbi:hypothetical protein J2X48_002428 [Bosea sp. BE271]|nr:hypothetical protein [Bosea robiniae]MDR6895399.1 hypothetical protein [Bosea sp. BE109]MDR7138795.1 hypothetical protein [Bosea sp. BE168]MDR7175496.1 hypothetical protein [Bosea sp. BE271]